jgi:hypothetical protein
LERHDKPGVSVHVLFILVARHHDGKSSADPLNSTDHLIPQICLWRVGRVDGGIPRLSLVRLPTLDCSVLHPKRVQRTYLRLCGRRSLYRQRSSDGLPDGKQSVTLGA